jgi:hypothetical protein
MVNQMDTAPSRGNIKMASKGNPVNLSTMEETDLSMS